MALDETTAAPNNTDTASSPDVSARVAALNGGRPLPQADTMAVAQRLLGPELAQRYGDVIGARPTNIADVARDFTLGFMSKDPTKADKIKASVMQAYNQEYAKQEQLAIQKDANDRAKVQSFMNLVKGIKDVPKQFRGGIMKSNLAKLGFNADPEVVKMLASPEAFDTGQLTSPDMIKMANDDPQGYLAKATDLVGDSRVAVTTLKELQGLAAQRQQTQDRILQGRRNQQASDAADRVAKYGTGLFGMANEEMAARQATGKGKFPIYANMSDEQVAAYGGPGKKTTDANSDEMETNAQTILQTIPKLRDKIDQYWTSGSTGKGLGAAVENKAKLAYQRNVTVPNAKASGELGEFDYLNSKVIPLIRVAGRGTKGLRITQAEFKNIGEAFANPENYTRERLQSYLDAVQHDVSQLVKEGKIGAAGGSSGTPNAPASKGVEIAPGVTLRQQ